MPRRYYDYYEETPEGEAFGAFGKGLSSGFTSGIERALNRKDKMKDVDTELGLKGYTKVKPGETYDPDTPKIELFDNTYIKRYTPSEIAEREYTKRERELKNKKIEAETEALKGGAYVLDEYGNVRPIPGVGSKTKVIKQESPSLDRATTLRKEFSGLPEVKDFKEIARAYQNMSSAYKHAISQGDKDSKAAADQALVVTFNKMIDPSSVVRESEYARTPTGQSAIARMQGFIEQVRQGGVGLTDKNREDVVAVSKKLMSEAQKTYKQQRESYTKLAADYRIDDPRLVVGDDLSLQELEEIMAEGQGQNGGMVGGQMQGKQGGQIMIDAQGNKAMVYPDGTYEEIP